MGAAERGSTGPWYEAEHSRPQAEQDAQGIPAFPHEGRTERHSRACFSGSASRGIALRKSAAQAEFSKWAAKTKPHEGGSESQEEYGENLNHANQR
jgi:hypothetical protein